MKASLTQRTRTLLLFLSAAGYTAWFSGLGERSDAAGIEGRYPVATGAPRSRINADLRVPIVRDPFSGRPAAVDEGPSQRVAGSSADVVVPDIGSTTSSSETSEPLALRATIVGHAPVAYVESGSTMNIVRVGDTLGERRVAQIDLQGITFGDGTRLVLVGSAASVAPRAPRPESVAHRLDQIRDILTHLQSQTHPTSAVTSIPTSQAPTIAPAYPSPAPLATVDARGIPVGTNPTSDPNAPTPYPYPYPYAPPRR